MTAARQLSRDEILALPPTISLVTLWECFGVSEPTIRAAQRKGELERLGIKINKLGQQWRVVTSTVLEYLGLADGASTAPSPGEPAGQRSPASPALKSVHGGGDAA